MAQRGGRGGGSLFNGYTVYVGGDYKVLGIDSGDGYTCMYLIHGSAYLHTAANSEIMSCIT